MTEIDKLLKLVKEDLDMFKGTTQANINSLITTIESQKEEIRAHQRALTIEAIKNANSEKRMKAYELQAIKNINLYEYSQEQLASQKAITELAVKGLERISVTFERGEMVRIAYSTLREIRGNPDE